MKLLSIDTSTLTAGVAAWQDGRTLAERRARVTTHSDALLTMVDEALREAGWQAADLDGVACVSGPGSFTGLRIGLSAARGLGLALNVPVIGIPSLLALSLQARCDAVAVLLDARRDEAYIQTFSGPGIPIREPALLPMDEARRLVPHGAQTITSPFVDIAALARFAATADPALYPPEASYIRGADAKPQEKFRVARVPGDVPA